MSYENDVEAENARLRAELGRWKNTCGTATPEEFDAGVKSFGGELEDEFLRRNRELEQSRDRERTALRERDAIYQELGIRTRERDEARKACAEFERGALDAEGERDDARRDCDLANAACSIAVTARDSADADCAAIQQMCHEVLNSVAGTPAEAVLRDIVSGRFSGSALLERLRAAEAEAADVGASRTRWQHKAEAAVAVVEAARPFVQECRAVFEVHHAPEKCALGLRLVVADGNALVSAFAAYDALGAKGEAVEP